MQGTANNAFASASLYVGDLHPDVTESLLCDIFSQVGPVASIRVCRDAITRRSLGYSYVNFHMMVDAERALDTMNYTIIKGRPIRIMWSYRDPSIRKSGKGNIFIKNLDKSIDNKMLYDTFCTLGNILSCKIEYDEKGHSKAFGYVHYETEEAAESAIEKVNGKMLKDKIVFVGRHRRAAERDEPGSEKKFTNIFVKNLLETATEDMVRAAFAPYGEITSLLISRNADTGKSNGFGFVNYGPIFSGSGTPTPEQYASAKKAVDEKNGAECPGLSAESKQLFVGRAQRKSERVAELTEKFKKMKQERTQKWQGVNLYVKNLDESLDDETFRQAFEVHGSVESCRIMRETEEPKRGKGFGFVCFKTPEEATKAVTAMQGHILANKPIYVALAQLKDERKAQLEAQMNQRAQQSRMQGAPGMYPYPQQVFYPQLGGQPRPTYYQQQQGPMGQQPRGGKGVFPQSGGKGFPQGTQQNGYNIPQQQQQVAAQRNRAQGGGTGSTGKGGGGRPGAAPPLGGKGGSGGRGAGGKGGPQVPVPVASGPSRSHANTARQPPSAPVAQAPVAVMPVQDFAAQLAAMPSEAQKNSLGERLFPMIEKEQGAGDQAGKITGMLLDMDTPELLHLIESPEALRAKVKEAIDVLAQHGLV